MVRELGVLRSGVEVELFAVLEALRRFEPLFLQQRRTREVSTIDGLYLPGCVRRRAPWRAAPSPPWRLTTGTAISPFQGDVGSGSRPRRSAVAGLRADPIQGLRSGPLSLVRRVSASLRLSEREAPHGGDEILFALDLERVRRPRAAALGGAHVPAPERGGARYAGGVEGRLLSRDAGIGARTRARARCRRRIEAPAPNETRAGSSFTTGSSERSPHSTPWLAASSRSAASTLRLSSAGAASTLAQPWPAPCSRGSGERRDPQRAVLPGEEQLERHFAPTSLGYEASRRLRARCYSLSHGAHGHALPLQDRALGRRSQRPRVARSTPRSSPFGDPALPPDAHARLLLVVRRGHRLQ